MGRKQLWSQGLIAALMRQTKWARS